MKKAILRLSDGTTFEGFSFGADVPVSGEVVFNTAMMGYPESLRKYRFNRTDYPPIWNPTVSMHGLSFAVNTAASSATGMVVRPWQTG